MHNPLTLTTVLVTAVGVALTAGDALAQGMGHSPTTEVPAPAREQNPGRWRLDTALDTPDWLQVSGETRLRWEGIDGTFRNRAFQGRPLDRSDNLGFQRTLLRFDVDFDPLGLEELDLILEGIDSRSYGASTGSDIGNFSNNAADFLQVALRYELGELGSGTNSITVGRQTLDLGSRRLVARNNYRNTINSFTGVNWHFEDDDAKADIFAVLPVERQPGSGARDDLADNELVLDEQDKDQLFFGAFYQRKSSDWLTFDMYVYFLHEDDQTSRRRELVTPGARAFRNKAKGQWDYEAELILQGGETADRDHRALFAHAEVGYTFDAPWTPRIQAQFDYATGDRDPNDNDEEGFNTLFGARRWEYGPTGIFRAIARSNMISPDVRLELKPRKNIGVMVAWRGMWLASEQDAWAGAGVSDASGAAGRHVGQQFETRIRWDLEDADIRLEIGGAYLAHGGFQSNAPNGLDRDTAYGYFQTRWRF